MASPKWATPERQSHLVRLFRQHGNKCLLGHCACPEPTHYVHKRQIALTVPIVHYEPCSDIDGNPIYYRDGSRAYSKEYKLDIDHQGTLSEVARLYDIVTEPIIQDWIADDRAQRGFLLRLQRQTLHRIPERGALRGAFSAISRTIFHDNQPRFYQEGIGISGLTFQPFAKVRLASSYTRLHVYIGDVLRGVSKNKRRKAVRYCGALPVEAQRQVDSLCSKAVADYLK